MNASNREMFKEIGITDTRLYDLACAMEGLQSSLGKLDDSNNRRFIVWVDGFDSFADAMNAVVMGPSYAVGRAMDNLRNAMKRTDDSNHRRFVIWVDSFDSFADAMNAFAGQTSDWLQDFHLAGLRDDF